MTPLSPSNSDAPDWSLLPHDPVRFFGLATGFDRNDLKRSYNRLLRLYKPEKHPAEFQQIRAAYEDLERGLRYGDAQAATGDVNWTSTDRPVSVAPQEDASGGMAPVAEAIDLEALAARLESGDESLAAAYDSLAKKRHKTPPDFYALALMGDAKGPAQEQLLLRWLLQGLKTWPGDSALSQLVYGYLRTQAPIDAIPTLLVMISKVITNDGFYRLTEGAWERLLRERPFAVFAMTLERCEANVAEGAGGDPAIGGRVAFYLFALRHALWKDASDWKDRTLEFVEEHFDQAPEHLVNDLDGLMIVREYLTHRAEFVAAHPLRARLDAVLEAAYTREQLEVDRRMTECQREIMASPETVAEAFPPDELEGCQEFYLLWAWLSEDVAGRIAPAYEADQSPEFWKHRVEGFLSQLNSRHTRQTTRWRCTQIAYTAGYFAICLIVFIVSLIGAAVGSAMLTLWTAHKSMDVVAVTVSIVVSVIVIIASVYTVNRYVLIPFDIRAWKPLNHRLLNACYEHVWRPPVFSFLRDTAMDFFTFRGIVATTASESPLGVRRRISEYVQQDFGLAVYSLAQRFRE